MLAKTIESSLSLFNLESNSSNKFIVLGSKHSGKSSLAFRYAYDTAVNGGTPLFVCNKMKIEGKKNMCLVTHFNNPCTNVKEACLWW
jgi:hypothetical protein